MASDSETQSLLKHSKGVADAGSTDDPAASFDNGMLLGLRPSQEQSDTSDDDAEAVRASRAMKCVLTSVGIASFSVPSCYIAAIGFYAERLDTETLGGHQFHAYYSFTLLTLIIQYYYDDPINPGCGVRQAYWCRIVVSGVVTVIFGLVSPMCTTSSQVVLLGAILGVSSTVQWSASAQLGSVLLPGGSIWTSTGCVLGNATAVVVAPLVGFSPYVTTPQAGVFFAIASAICAIGTSSFLLVHCASGESEAARSARPRSTPSERLTHCYRTIDSSQSKDCARRLRIECDLVTVALVTNQVTSFVPCPLFPFVGPWASQRLSLARLLGECIGQMIAIAHTFTYRRDSLVPMPLQRAVTLLCCIKAVLVVYMVKWLQYYVHFERLPVEPFWVYATCVLVYAISAFGDAMFCLAGQLAAPVEERTRATLINVVCDTAGIIVGLALGTVMLEWLPQE